MEYLGVTALKDAYAKSLLEDNDNAKAEKIYTSEFTTPVYEHKNLHGEDQIDIETLGENFKDISVDITALEYEIANAAQKYKELINNIKIRLASVSSRLSKEENRIKDLNIICGNYNEFTAVKSITRNDVDGNAGIIGENVFCAKATSQVFPDLIIDDITGNGYEGNDYVLNETGYKKDSGQTSDRSALTDGSFSYPYEYSRITSTGKKNEDYPSVVNFDQEEARCTITLHSDKSFNMLFLENNNNIIVEDISISDDAGRTYKSSLSKRIELGNDDLRYDNCDYVYGEGIVAFPSTQYAKITLASNGITEEKIGWDKLNTDNGSVQKYKRIELSNANRHVISLNEINTISGQYTQGDFYIRNIVKNPATSIAIFANEYIPSYFDSSKEYFRYVLTVNGIDYDVVPINSNKEGTKVIRIASSANKDSNSRYINETIKSASLHVLIDIPDSASTPYLSNLKICLGGGAF